MVLTLMAARRQASVIGALILREIHTRYGRDNIGFLWVIGEPALFCSGVTLLFSAIRPAHEHGIQTTAFIITGYTPLTMWRHCVSRSAKAFESNGSLFYHRWVTPLDVLLARVVLEVAGSIVAGILIGGVAILLGFMDLPDDFGLLYLGLAYHVVFCLSSALIISSLSEMSDIVEKFLAVVTYLAIPFSGAFVMVEWLPPALQDVVLWSPSVHALEIMRQAEFGSSIRAHYSISFLTETNAILLLIGLSLAIRSRRHILVQ